MEGTGFPELSLEGGRVSRSVAHFMSVPADLLVRAALRICACCHFGFTSGLLASGAASLRHLSPKVGGLVAGNFEGGPDFRL